MLEENIVHEGDCRELIPRCYGNKPKGFITDFPYGINFQSNNVTRKFNKILNDKKPFIDKWIRQAYNILPEGGFLMSFYRWDVQDVLFDEIEAAGFDIKNQLIWLKGSHGMGDLSGAYGEGHECIVFAVKGRFKFPAHTGRPVNILHSIGGAATSNSLVHPNEKPLYIMQRLVRDTTEKGDLIIEPFSGSGKTLAACLSEGRRCIAMELDNRIVERIGMNYIDYGNKMAQEYLKTGNKLF